MSIELDSGGWNHLWNPHAHFFLWSGVHIVTKAMLLSSIRCPVLEIVLCSFYTVILQKFRQFWTFISFPMNIYHLWDGLKSVDCLNYYPLLRTLFRSLKIFLDFTYFYFMCMKVCLNVCQCHVYAVLTETRRGIQSPGTGVQIESHHKGAGDLTQDFFKSRQCC